jgi:hypothetical protein
MFGPEVEARFKRIEHGVAAIVESQRQMQEQQRQMQEQATRSREEWELRQKELESKLYAFIDAQVRAEGEFLRRHSRLDDALTVQAEIVRRFEIRTEDRLVRLETIQNAMAQWQAEMSETLAELSRTVDRFLKARTNGGAG